MSATTYTAPVDKLLTLGKAEPVDSDKWPDYLELGLGPEHIPDLIRIATDRELRSLEPEEGEEEEPGFWAPVHAMRALGQLHAEAAAEPLVNLLAEVEHDNWVSEELPQIYALIGPAAIPALAAYLADSSHEIYSRGHTADGLELIGKWHPESRLECIAALSKQLEAFEENDYELNAFLISSLAHLKAVETLPLIERAFEADRVDEFVISLDDVLVGFGLKEREVVESPFLEMFKTPLPAALKQAGKPFSPPKTSYSQRLTRNTSDQVIKFSHKKITKKKSKKKR